MKKTLIAVAAAAALATSSAFAEITFGAWLRVLASPVASNGDDVVAGMQNSWGWGARTARLDVNAVSEDGKAGFGMGIFNDAFGGLGDGDYARLWVMPVDMVKVSVGKFTGSGNVTGTRGDFTYGSWNWVRPYNWLYDGEGLTFDPVSKTGLLAELFPVEGLHVFAAVPLNDEYDKAEDIYKNIQAGFVYSIESVGAIKAQYIGDYSKKVGKTKKVYALRNFDDVVAEKQKKNENYEWDGDLSVLVEETEVSVTGGKDYETTGTIGVAFDLTAVENLYVTIGARFGIADKEWRDSDGNSYLKAAVTAGVSYQVTEEFKVSIDGGFKMFQDKTVGKADDPDDDMLFGFGVGLDYAIMDGLAAAADVRFLNTGYGKDGDDNSISFLVGLNKSVGGNGSIGIGFQGATNGCGLGVNGSSGIKAAPDGDEFVWAIPVSVSVWF